MLFVCYLSEKKSASLIGVNGTDMQYSYSLLRYLNGVLELSFTTLCCVSFVGLASLIGVNWTDMQYSYSLKFQYFKVFKWCFGVELYNAVLC